MLALLSAAALSASSFATALAGRPECVAFEWKGTDRSAKGAIVLPVTVDGKHMRWQLDTGADVNMSYGSFADRAGLSSPKDGRFQVRTLMIGAATITDSFTFIRRDMSSKGDVTGTLGLNSLIGRISVIDYPSQKFCIFNEASLPEPFWSITYAKAVLRDRKFFVPVEVGTFKSDSFLFDTGSSEVPLNVDMSLWSRMTGKVSAEQSSRHIEGQAWGKRITLFGSQSFDDMRIGKLSLGKQLVYTENTGDTFAAAGYKIDGIMGNAAVWDGIVVLDLTVRTRFGVVRP